MNKIQITYEMDCDFEQSLRLVSEIESEIGMTPTFIVYDGKKIDYNYHDSLQVIANKITSNEYIKKYLIL